MLDLIKIEDQTSNCREIYKDIDTGRLYCRHISNRYSKGIYVNFWNTFTEEPDCPLKNGTEIRINNKLFIIERDKYTGWAIEKPNGEVKTNEFQDEYVKKEMEYSSDKKRNAELWDNVDNVAQTAIENIADLAGVIILDWGDLSDIKEVTEHLTQIVKDRFNAEIPYVDEDF